MFILRLAIPSPLRRSFDYLPPPGLDGAVVDTLQPGVRLQVPFGKRELTGYLLSVERDSDLSPDQLKPALGLLDERPLLNARMMQLCLWATAYYHHPVGEVFSAIFPRRLRRGQPHQTLDLPGWGLTTRGKGLPADALARSPRQAQALALLREAGQVTAERLAQEGIKPAVMRSLRDKGLAETVPVARQREPGRSRHGLTLNPEQAMVLEALRKAGEGFSCHLLEGVTGSGKTEIYLQLIADCLQRGRQALVLIPEIGLTPQTLGRFRDRFSADIVVLHSGLADTRRYNAWEAARDGSADIIIGTRSAVFTPMSRPGLIIVDEEHDTSYKQQDGFRYSARDVAVKRGQLEACPVLLGSATPSLESTHNALTGRYHHHRLTRRAGGAALPAISALDVRRRALQAGLADALIDEVEKTLQANRQVLLFLNRRGYAPTLQCHDCGWVAGCDGCDARLTVHRRQSRLRCHHCGASRLLPRQCPYCNSRNLLASGLGTEQTEMFLRQRFPSWPVYRVDSDSMQGRDAMQELVEQINTGAPCILLGTQMLTKGHHFPRVGLVAILDTDAMLFSADFRGEERMAQLLTQVAGRAGRADTPGRVILQTHYPDHPSVEAMLTRDYADQARELLARRLAAGMPPGGFLAMLRSDCADMDRAETFLRELRDKVERQLPRGTTLIGPLPSPMQRRAGKFRCQLLLTAHGRGEARAAAKLLVQSAEAIPVRHGLNWFIDIDPQDLF